jgi:hypothetical protein
MVDPIVGAPVTGADGRTAAKLVDLDPEQQMVSEIWGFQVIVGGSANGFTIRGDFEVASFGDIWFRYPSGQQDSCFGAFYQSVLKNLDWTSQSTSRFLNELGQPAKLSIKFNVDGYNDDSTSATFTFGRVVGTIGPYVPGEPEHFLAARALPVTQGVKPAMGTAYAVIDGDVLLVDLGNSLPTQSPAGPIVTTLGRLYAAALSASGPVRLGEIEYTDPNWYAQTAGIAALELAPDQLKLAQNSPLAIAQSSASRPLLSEAANGAFLRADKFVFRLDPGETATTTLYATRFGQRYAKQPISLGYDPKVMQVPVSGLPNVGTPESALQFQRSIMTGPDGTVELELKAADPGHPRAYIDGQVYGVTYQLGSTPPPIGSVQNGSQFLSARVFSDYRVPDEPNWIKDVRPIFQQYADLYPVMRPVVDLANVGSVISRRAILKRTFNTRIDDPNYMPVTRDLSGGKRAMIRKWLDNPIYMNLDSAEDLMQALQLAIELEHSSIPPYLCALYSIKPGANVAVSDLIRSVVVEEMLHMALVANIFVSIGGKPDIGHARFVPRYPAPLPGGLRTSLIVRLRRCSIEQIRDCFVAIEEPEETRQSRRCGLEGKGPVTEDLFTVGWFYDEITKALRNLSASGKIRFGNEKRQVKDWSRPGKLFVIGTLEDAQRAIQEIKDQGEGRSPSDPDAGRDELAHYYKFSEIVAGRQLIRTKAGVKYEGAPIPFDSEGVWPMIDDPNAVLYPKGSRALILAQQFAESYQALLQGLNRTFNGEPEYLNQAIGVMYSLDLQARQLMQTPSGIKEGTNAGPSFQLPVPGLG